MPAPSTIHEECRAVNRNIARDLASFFRGKPYLDVINHIRVEVCSDNLLSVFVDFRKTTVHSVSLGEPKDEEVSIPYTVIPNEELPDTADNYYDE